MARTGGRRGDRRRRSRARPPGLGVTGPVGETGTAGRPDWRRARQHDRPSALEGSTHGPNAQRSSLLDPHAPPHAGVQCRRRCHARAGHRRDDRGLRGGGRRAAAPVCVPAHGSAGAPARDQLDRPDDVDLVAELRRLARAERGLRGDRRLPRDRGVARRRRDAGAAERQPRLGVGLRVDGHRAPRGPRVQRTGRCPWRGKSGDHQRAALA